MRPGSPGFVGARLREGREARGFTATMLADQLGVSRAAISLWENGGNTPNPDLIPKISDRLQLPIEFFWKPVRERQRGRVFYRSQSAATKFARIRANRRFVWFHELVHFVRQYVESPSVDFPTLDIPIDPSTLSHEQIEAFAAEMRSYWELGDGPIPNLVWLLENHGAFVTRGSLDADTLDAFSEWAPEEGAPLIMLNSDKDSAVRSRWDAAHELGHMVLHRHLEATQAKGPAEHKLLEEQAHQFARAFLLPAHSFADEVFAPTLDVLRVLKSKWRVSIAAMLSRIEELELVTADQADVLFRSRARRGWIKWEPLDDEIPIEEPRVVRRSIELLVEEKIVRKRDVFAALTLTGTDIEELATLPQGFLDEQPPNVVLLSG
jgi:Zn-dependent peptidase ImmA (M78 family)/DNA-binding XRE family transcriptional regulator